MDIIGKRKIAIRISLIAIAIGIFSIFFHNGLRYGVDFAGGSTIIVKLDKPVTVELLEKIRTEFSARNINASLQIFGKAAGESNKIKVSTLADTIVSQQIVEVFNNILDTTNDTTAQNKEDINALKSSRQIGDALKSVFLKATIDKIIENRPFNDSVALLEKLKIFNLTAEELTAIFVFSEPDINDSRKNINQLDNSQLENIFNNIYSSVKYNNYFSVVAENALKHIDASGGIIKTVDELKPVLKIDDALFDLFKNNFTTSSFIIESNNMVGPSIGADYRRKGLFAIIFSVIGMLLYIAWRFEFEFALGAVAALIHDVLITIGIFSLLDKEFNTQILAALLTIIGYSLNDTIVVFDRIREKLKTSGALSNLSLTFNASIIETLSRTIMTSFTTLIAVIALFVFGGEVYRDFSLALTIGIVVGTYSSIFIASPVVLYWKKSKTVKKAK